MSEWTEGGVTRGWDRSRAKCNVGCAGCVCVIEGQGDTSSANFAGGVAALTCGSAHNRREVVRDARVLWHSAVRLQPSPRHNCTQHDLSKVNVEDSLGSLLACRHSRTGGRRAALAARQVCVCVCATRQQGLCHRQGLGAEFIAVVVVGCQRAVLTGTC